MSDVILVLNAGSSTIKFAVYPRAGDDSPMLAGVVDRIGGAAQLSLTRPDRSKTETAVDAPDHEAAFDGLADALDGNLPDARVIAVGHRMVHGGAKFTAPTPLSPPIVEDLEALVLLAPLHQRHGLRGVQQAEKRFPQTPQIACFDTAFHAAKPWLHDSFALPAEYYDEGIRRYGFHGLSCQSVIRRLRADGYPVAERRIVIAHLGNGCSATAVKDGHCHATSMGFSTLDGLMMGTRCGRLDPGVILYWLRQGKTVAEIEQVLYHESGLIGVSGLSNDMRDLSGSDNPAAERAIDAFVTRVVEEICRLAGTMGGVDAVVFCGGIGENAADIRDRVAAGLGFLGDGGPEILVRKTEEEEEIMLAAREQLDQPGRAKNASLPG